MMRVILSKLALESLERLSPSDRSRVADAIDRLQAGSERTVSRGDRLVSPTTSRSYFRYRVSLKLHIVLAIDRAQRAIYVVDIATKWSGPSGVPRKGARSEDSSLKTLWSRSTPHLGLEQENTVAELHRVLERICQSACERVRRIHAGVTPADFRVHVVLPDYSQLEELGTYQLFLAKDLRVGDHGTDESLRLSPGQGVAGRAFLWQAPQKARITIGPDGVPIWPDQYEYTETYKRSMPADLRWLVAIPLRVPRTDQKLETMGVLGIQGLKYELTDDQLDAVIGFLLSYVMVVAALISGLPLHVGVSEESAELPPGENVLSEVTFEHLTDSDKKVLTDAGFSKVRILIESRDPEVRRQAEVELARRYFKKLA